MLTDALAQTSPRPNRLRAARIAVRQWLYARGLKSTAGLDLPDFLGIGAQKAGTSWLHFNLRVHPGAFLPEPKEVHFFDQKFEQGLERYCDLFRAGRGKVKGEITPAYGILPPGRVRFIRATMPDVRLIFLMRNPVDRAWSHAMMSLAWQVGRRYEDVTDAEFLAHFRGEANTRRGDYDAILENWLSRFPREQFFLGYFEDIAARPRELLSSVFAFLGLKNDVDWTLFPYNEVVYKGADVPLPPRYREVLTEMYAPRIERLRARFGTPVERWLMAPKEVTTVGEGG